MDREGDEKAEGERRNVFIVYDSDGIFATTPVAADLTTIAETNDGDVHGEGQAVWKTAGRWSAEDRQLNRCIDQSRFRGEMTITPPDDEVFHSSLPMPQVSGVETVRYTCSETNLKTTLAFPGISRADGDTVFQNRNVRRVTSFSGAPFA